jgi:hypothetical protein
MSSLRRFMGPEPSCPYIDEIIHWLDPDIEINVRFETTHSELTREEIIEYLEKIRSINQDLRSERDDLIKKNQQLEYRILELQL